MEKIIELLGQRRIWAGIVGAISFLLTMLHFNFQLDVPFVTDVLAASGGALATLITSALALWSYFKPKK